MTNKKSTRMLTILVALVLIASLFMGVTIARYVTSTSSEDSARVAIWGINEAGTEMNLFKNEYKLEDNTVIAKSNDDTNIIAPGLNGVSKFKILSASAIAPEVIYEVKINVDSSQIANEIKNHPGIQWKVDDNEWGTWDEFQTQIKSLAGDPSGIKVYAPGTVSDEFANGVEHTVAWQWVMDSGYDEEDTRLGNLAVEGPISAKIVVTVTAEQTDASSLNMLDGANQTINLANLESASFRSAANIEDFESVSINGDTVDPTNYDVTEGSTIITFHKDYLATLDEGVHTITINSKNNFVAKASFYVVDHFTQIEHGDTIPEGGTYYVGVTENSMVGSNFSYTTATAVYHAGDTFPEIKTGDIYVYGDYEYRYNMKYENVDFFWFENQSQDGWGVRPLNTNKKRYGAILTTINGKNITSMYWAFFRCENLVKAPAIPKYVTDTTGAFYQNYMLSGDIEINATNLKTYNYMLEGTGIMSISGPISNELKQAIANDSNITLREVIDGGDITKTGIYYVGSTGNYYAVNDYTDATTIYINGAFPKEPQTGDIYVYGDYEYRYNMEFDDTQHWILREDRPGWGVGVSENKSEYGTILSTINGNPVVNLSCTFWWMNEMTKAPIIPSTIKYMGATFLGCTNLTEITINSTNLLTYGDMLKYTNVSKINGSISSELKREILRSSDSANIPKYYSGNNVYFLDEQLPTVKTGDIVLSGDYEYRYNMTPSNAYNNNVTWKIDETMNSWGVRVIDKTKTSYGEMLSNINGKNIEHLTNTFSYCENLSTPPIIPNTVKTLDSTFGGCISLETPPIIPNGVISMNETFSCAGVNVTGMIIPSSVKTMQWTFAGNYSVKGKLVLPENVIDITGIVSESSISSLEINGNPEKYDSALDISSITDITGTISKELKAKILATGLPTSYLFKYNLDAGIYMTGNVTSNNVNTNAPFIEWNGYYADKLYVNGEIPDTISTGDIFIKGEYEYKYNYSFNGTQWVLNESQNGWGVRFGNSSWKDDPNNSLSTIGGKPVIK